MRRRIRNLWASRKTRIVALVVLIGSLVATYDLDLLPRPLPEAGVLVLDLRQGLPDKAETAPDGRRSVSAITVLRALDAARDDPRIAGLYLRVGGGGMALAQAQEIADAVLRVRRARKFAVVYTDHFTAANFSDRVLAAAGDDIWIAAGQDISALTNVQTTDARIPFSARETAVWHSLLLQAAARISVAAKAGKTGRANLTGDLARDPGELPAPQIHRGPEARAERAALAWGGVGADFVDLLTYRETLDRNAAGASVVALIQADGVLDTHAGPHPRDLAGKIAERLRGAAGDAHVKGIIVRISAPAASDKALTMLLDAANDARSRGVAVGISFGPLVPASASALRADIPITAPEGALLVNLVPGADAAALAQLARFPWRADAANGPAMAAHPFEMVLLRHRAAVGLVTASKAPEASEATDVPEARNPVAAGAFAKRSAFTSFTGVRWTGEVGSLLDLRDRLVGSHGQDAARTPPIVPYDPGPSVWSRTKARFVQLWTQAMLLIAGKQHRPNQ